MIDLSHYGTLGILHDATSEQISAAYEEKAARLKGSKIYRFRLSMLGQTEVTLTTGNNWSMTVPW